MGGLSERRHVRDGTILAMTSADLDRELDVAHRRQAASVVGTERPSTPQLWVNPYLTLLEEVARTQAQVVALEVDVRALDENAGGAHRSREGRLVLSRWERERDRLINVSKTCISLNIAERHVKLAQVQGESLARAFLSAADKLGLTPEQRTALPGLVRDALREAGTLVDALSS